MNNDTQTQTNHDELLVTLIHTYSCLGWGLTKLRFSYGYELHFTSLSDPSLTIEHYTASDAADDVVRAHFMAWIREAERPQR